MKKFIIKLGCFLLVLSVICLAFAVFDVLVIKNQYSQSYTSALNDKLERLKSIEENKIILVGDSNLAFGINSEMIEKELGMPVVNMGLHGSIGDAYYEELVKPYIKKGDIVIIAPGVFKMEGFFDDKSLVIMTLEKNSELWEAVPTEEKWELILAYPYYAYSCLTKWISGTGNQVAATSYSRDAFNEYGDVVKRPAEYGKTQQELFGNKKTVSTPKYNAAFFDRINAYQEFVTAKGAVLLMTTYPVVDYQDPLGVKKFETFETVLRENLNCPIISRYEDYFFAKEYFYDTGRHLTQEGADLRTAQLIQDLKQYLDENSQ